MFYITTSRKPSLTTKRLCRALALLLPRGLYENRGKKSIEDVFARAKSLGKRRALLLYEQNGNPSSILFMRIDDSWEWLEPEIKISGVRVSKTKISQSAGAKISGEKAGALSRLLGLEKEECDEDEMSAIKAGAREITFSRNKKIILVLKT